MSRPLSGSRPRRRYTTLWVMIALFGLPYLLAAIFFYTDELRENLPLANKGELLSPLVALPDVALEDRDGQGFRIDALRGQGVLLYVNRGACDRACEQTLYYMRQVRLALGEERFRIERVALLPRSTDARIQAELDTYQPEMIRLDAGTDAAARFLQPLGPAPARGGRLYLVDPQGRAALYYDEIDQPKDLLSDLKRLIGGGRG